MKIKTRKYYLAYGMNTNKDSMQVRCPAAESLGKVTLKNHRLTFQRVCDAEYQPGASMECALWTITDECERSLDLLEGFPDFYGKKEVTVDWQGRKIRAMIYYMKDFYGYEVPSEYYLNTVTQGYFQHDMPIMQIIESLEDLSKCTLLRDKIKQNA